VPNLRTRAALAAAALMVVLSLGSGGYGQAQSGGPAGTTLEGTVTGGDPKQGFATLTAGPGEPFVAREDLAAAKPGREQRRRSLIYFGQISDYQLSDEESPARVEFLDRDPSGFARSAWRPQEALLAQLVDWSNRQLNERTTSPVAQGDGARAQMTNAVLTGDLADNQQKNETEWVLREIEGGRLDPNSGTAAPDPLCPLPALLDDPKNYTGVQDYGDAGTSASFYDPNTPAGPYATWPNYPGLLDRAQQPFDAAGIRVPSYVVFGNHDGLVQGNVNANAAYVTIATGCTKPTEGGGTMSVPPDPNRRMLSKVEYKNVFKGGTQADGHGFRFVSPAEETASGGSAGYYAWTPRPGVRFIVIDTLAEAGLLPDSSDGNIDDPQFKWLENELKGATARDQLAAVFSHHARASLVANHPDEDAGACTSADPAAEPNPGCDRDPRDSAPIHLGADLEALFHRYPNMIAHVAGHSHQNQVNFYKAEGGGGYWEVKSAAIADWPPQHRVMDVLDNCDGTLSLFGAVVDPGVPLQAPPSGTPGASMDQRTLASVARLLTYNDPQEGPLDGDTGKATDRNVELLLKDPRRLPPACAGANTGGTGGGGGQGGAAPKIKLSVKPKRVLGGRRTCFRFKATSNGRVVPGAKIGFAGRRTKTGSKGTAKICRRVYRPQKKAYAKRSGFQTGRTSVTVMRRRR
jgi:metallophosphoesterase (TIGR03767 family)